MKLRFMFVSLLMTALACSLPTDAAPETTQVVESVENLEPQLLEEESSQNAAPTESVPTVGVPELDNSPLTEFNADGLNAGPGQGFVVLDDPVMVPASEANWLQADDIVLGVEQNGEAQAFPINQMAYHHVANTRVGGEPYLVTY